MIYRFIIVSLSGIIALFAIRSCQRTEKDLSSIGTIQEIKNDSTRYWKDLAGREHAEKRIAEGSLEAIKVSYRREIDSLKKNLKIKDNALQSFVSANTETKDRVILVVDTFYFDTSKVYHFNYHDQWITLQGEIAKEPYIRYSVRDTITFVTYSKKKGWFLRETYVDGFSQNPNTRITGLNGVRVSQPAVKKFSIGPYVGYGFNSGRWTPSAGISLQYSLVKF